MSEETWAVIWLCTAMMVAEIVGGWLFGSIALIADGLHMSTRAARCSVAALAYTYARCYANDTRFTFGTGKLGDLAGFTSAIILAMIALLIGYESGQSLRSNRCRFISPRPFRSPASGLIINLASAWLLSGGHHHDHGHSHGHGHRPAHTEHDHDDQQRIATRRRQRRAGGVSRTAFRPFSASMQETGAHLVASAASIETVRPDGTRQVFALIDRGDYLESVDDIPEPHAFDANVSINGQGYPVTFEEHEHAHGAAVRDNNMRAAVIHVIADAAVSVLVIVGLVLARAFGWLWMDPLAEIIGAFVIASWSFGLIRDTGAILLDMNPDRRMADNLRRAIESEGDQLADLHLWRLGPGHLGAIVSVVTPTQRGEAYYRSKMARFRALSHLTIEVRQAAHASAGGSSGSLLAV